MEDESVHSKLALTIARSISHNPTPPPLPPPPFPSFENSPCAACGASGGHVDKVVACDACERAFHVECVGEVEEEWVCVECVRKGVKSRRWPLGVVKSRKRRLVDEEDGGSVSRKHTPADNSFAGLQFGASVTNLNSLNAGKGTGLQREAGDITKADELSFEDIKCDKDFYMMQLNRLKDYISRRGGVLPENWYLSILQSSISDEAQVVYYSPTGLSFQSMREVAFHLGLISNDDEDPEEHFLYAQLIDLLPIKYLDFFVLSLGKVDPRLSYHNDNNIWPVGYKSCWHDKITGSNFFSEVLDGGEFGPVFKVSRFSCSRVSVPSLCTLLFALNHGQNKEKQDVDNSRSDEEHLSFQALLADPPTENDSRCCLENSGASILIDEIGEFCIQESSSSAAWRMVSEKLVNIYREMYRLRRPLDFGCEHFKESKDEDSCSYMANLSGSSGSFKIPSVIDGGVEIETVLEGLRKWLDQDRFGLEVGFVQKITELLPGAHACSKYNPLKSRSDSTIGNSHLEVVTKDGKHIKGEQAINNLVERCRKVKAEINQDPIMACPKLPPGKPACAMLPSEIVGDAIQVMEFFQRFAEVLEVEGLLSADQLEMELSSPYLCNDQRAEFGFTVPGSSHKSTSGSSLSVAHMSLLKVLYGELLNKLSKVMDPSSDLRDSKPKRGRKKSIDVSILSCRKNPNMLPLNELTWPELARRYLLAVLFMDGEADSSESGNVYRCLIGDGGELCGSLTGVLGMEADALLLAQAMKKFFGSMDREYDMLTVEESGADQSSACVSSCPSEDSIPEWAQLLEPVRRLPTNVGARIRKCVYAALEKNPPEWAKKILENSISKDVYKGNASGPTKKAVLSVLNIVCPEGEGQKPVKEKKKAEEERKVRNYVSVSDIVMRQCRIIWRQVANADGQKVLCNLLGRRHANSYDSEDEGILGSPSSVPRLLDYRTIDLKLAVGAYDRSHESFLEDVREFWNHVHISCGDKPDVLLLADNLASKFNELYDREVLGLYQKLQGYARLGCLTADSKNEVDRAMEYASSLPKAPWEAGICKICGIDKDDRLVLLCDTCDAEYHTYCLNPPLARVPPGNWHCPCCVAKQDEEKETSSSIAVSCGRSRRNIGEFTGRCFDELTKLVSVLENKDYWDYSVNERTTLLKFLCDESLNLTLLRQHLELCSETFSELNQKLRSNYIDLRNVKKREETLAEAYTSFLPPGPAEDIMVDSTDNVNELNSVKNEITLLRDSLGNLEMQLMKFSGRREFLGTDSAGRLYWVWSNAGRQLCVIVNNLEASVWQGSGIPNLQESVDVATPSSRWVIYQSASEIKELVDFLRDSDERERELKWLISSRLNIRFQDSDNETLDETPHASFMKDSPGSETLFTKAAGLLESAYGSYLDVETVLLKKKGKYTTVISDEKLFRCSCLEPILPSTYHCLSCHRTFPTKRESDGHNDNQCKSGLPAWTQNKYDSSAKSGSFVPFAETKVPESDGLKCPFNFEEIRSNFVTMDSLKDLVRGIGFLGSNGVPVFLSSESPNLSDPALKLNVPSQDATSKKKDNNSTDEPDGPENKASDKNVQNSHVAISTPFPKSHKPTVGEAHHVLVQLKMNLLDMEAALPKTAFRESKACIRRRWAWRAYVKSAITIHEMVQAMIVFEDMIKSEYLKNSRWYWSSLSAAAKISTMSALALRIYALDASIIYDKSASNFNVGKSDGAESSAPMRKTKKRRSE